ncbi:MAG: hypothetical protein ABIP20_05100 [Chthoniobacteraceae bacterium]
MSRTLLAAALSLCIAFAARAATSNGNDFALALVEAKTSAAKKAVLDDAKDRPHFFRYLQIMEMDEVKVGEQTGVRITAFEPASYLDVKFTITMPNSLALLREDPVTQKGNAIAVTGKVLGLDPLSGAILLDQTIVRNKDRLSPKIGKELLSEISPGATFYSYTEGPRPIKLEARDRDLLQRRDEIMAKGGPKAWFEFLETEIAKRKQQRAAEAAKRASKP